MTVQGLKAGVGETPFAGTTLLHEGLFPAEEHLRAVSPRSLFLSPLGLQGGGKTSLTPGVWQNKHFLSCLHSRAHHSEAAKRR